MRHILSKTSAHSRSPFFTKFVQKQQTPKKVKKRDKIQQRPTEFQTSMTISTFQFYVEFSAGLFFYVGASQNIPDCFLL